jgi:hypothetical protein
MISLASSAIRLFFLENARFGARSATALAQYRPVFRQAAGGRFGPAKGMRNHTISGAAKWPDFPDF